MPARLSITDWLSAHLPVVGWSFVIAVITYASKIAWRASRFFDKADAIHATVLDIKGNHLHHIEASQAELVSGQQNAQRALNNIDDNITGLRNDFRTYFVKNLEHDAKS